MIFFVKSVLFLLIFLTTIFIGNSISIKYSNRVKDLREIKNALNNFKTKIKFTYEPIPEIFKQISKNMVGEVGNLFKKASESMSKTNAGEAWKDSIDTTNIDISPEDREILKNLSKLLGKTDLEGQVSEIDLTLSFLDTQIDKAEKERAKNEKLYKTLGVMTGLGIIIILL